MNIDNIRNLIEIYDPLLFIKNILITEGLKAEVEKSIHLY